MHLKSWFRRLEYSKSTWSKILLNSLVKINPNITIEKLLYNTGTIEIMSIAKKIENPFWSEALKCFKPALSNFLLRNPSEILFTPIWNSYAFLANKRPCNRTNFNTLTAHITYPTDIMHLKSNKFDFLSTEELESRLGVTIDNYQYISIKEVIRHSMAIVRFNFVKYLPEYPIIPSGKSLINLCQKGCNKWSDLFRKRCNRSIINCERKWEESLGSRQGVLFWDRNYKNVKNIFFDNKLKLFFYYIVRGTLKTNRIVSHHKRNIPVTCSFCNDDTETIVHLFWECRITANFIADVRTIFDRISPNTYTKSNRLQFVFSFPSEQIYDVNNILNLYIKHYIWKMKFANRILIVNNFLKWLSFEWNLNVNAFERDIRLNGLLIEMEKLKAHLNL